MTILKSTNRGSEMVRVFNGLTNRYNIQDAFRQRTKWYSLTLEVSCYKYLKKQDGICTACAELIIITHIELICHNLLEEKPHFRLKFLD